MDRKKFFENFRDFEDVIPPTIQKFTEVYPRLIEQIREAIHTQNGSELRLFAHSLKSSVAYFCAYPSINAAQRLEEMGAQSIFIEAESVFDELQRETGHLLETLSAMTNELKLRS